MSTIKVDTITDEAGSGAPDFPNGMTGSGSATFGSIIATGAAASYTDTGLYLQNKGSSVFDVGAWRSGASAAELTFSTDSGSDAAPVEAMRIDSAGRVGIGTNNPNNLLHVEGASGSISSMRVANPDVGLKLSAYTNSHGEIRVETNHPLVFKTNGNSEKMRIQSGGNVGINTINPATALDVDGTVTATAFAGDGSALTGVGGSTTYGAVGTYLWANRGSSTSTISSNSTYAGSGLYPTGLKAFIYPAAGIGYHVSNGPNPAAIGSGTWRAMGQSVGGNTSYSYLYPSTIFVRIA